MKRLRRLREQRGWSQAQLSYRAEVHAATISQIELGRLRPRDDSVILERLARALGWQGEPAALLDEVPAGEGEP